jgi:C1A family cysteine protease
MGTHYHRRELEVESATHSSLLLEFPGILMDQTCWADTNHAVAGVGYTPKYIVVKNSWGAGWGESGFFKLMRGWSNCGLYLRAQYPVMELTGELETEEAAEPSNYDHSAIVGPDPPKPDR